MSARYTYAISNGGHIKIGRTSDIEKRLQTLQLSSPYRLEVVAIADWDIELRTHARLEREGCGRVVGEWFEDTRRLRDQLWRLGFVAVAQFERDHRAALEVEWRNAGHDAGFAAGIALWNRAMGVMDEGTEEHW